MYGAYGQPWPQYQEPRQQLVKVTGMEGASAWWLIILFALIFGWGGNGFGNRGANGEPVTEAGLCSATT